MWYYRMSSCTQQPATNYGPGVVYLPPAIPEVIGPNPSVPDINANTCTSVQTVQTGIYADTSFARDSSGTYAASEVSSVIHSSMNSGESGSSKSVYSSNIKTSSGGKGNDKCSKMNGAGKNTVVITNKINESDCTGGQHCQSEKSEERAEKKAEREGEAKEKEKTVEVEDSGSDHMDVGSDGDSGCPSECADLSPINATDSEFVATDSTSGAGDGSNVTENGKPRGKRRYYMYGNHKLIKPIKEIPLRFQMLLAETSAAKARCEGQPIYMQQSAQPQQPSYDIVYYHTHDGSQPQQTQSLNANASCFVPSQNGDCTGLSYVPDEYTVCPVNNFSDNSSSAALQPAPMFVPPPPPMLNSSPSNSAQTCPTIIMYSAASTASSFPQNLQSSPACTPSSQTLPHTQPLTMPPPFPPPPSVPPPSVETAPLNYPPTVAQLKPGYPVNSAPCPSPLITKSGMKKNAAPSKPLTLNIPPTSVAMSKSASHTIVHSSTLAANPAAPNPNACLVPMPSNPYSTLSHSNVNTNLHAVATNNPGGIAPQVPHSASNPPSAVHVPSVPSSSACVSYPSNSGNQYMYVYPSTPTGPPTNPPQGAVMYMVSPAYPTTNYPSTAFQQQGLIMPSVATQ